jgi:hypothetical protein
MNLAAKVAQFEKTTPVTPGSTKTYTPVVDYSNGVLTFAVDVNELLAAAKPSSTGKSEGVMLDLRSNFKHTVTIDGTEIPLVFRTSSGRMGTAWFTIDAVGKAN